MWDECYSKLHIFLDCLSSFPGKTDSFINIVKAWTASPKMKILLLGPLLWFQLGAGPPEHLRQWLGIPFLHQQPIAPKSIPRTGAGIINILWSFLVTNVCLQEPISYHQILHPHPTQLITLSKRLCSGLN